MSISYYTCAVCDYNFPDCADDIVWCDCGNHFCSDDCAKMIDVNAPDDDDEEYEEDWEENLQCCICRKEEANDGLLFEALLRHYNITREDALKIWQELPEDEDDEES